MKAPLLLTIFLGTIESIARYNEPLVEPGILSWVGSFHLILNHFPIALIIMTCVAEVLCWWTQDPLFDSASRFMLLSAAILAIPTVLCGLALANFATYTGELGEALWRHLIFGIMTTLLVIAAAYVREYRYSQHPLYYSLLTLSFVTVMITGYYGGEISFGKFYFLPPFLFS